MRKVATVGFALGIGWLASACTVDMEVGDWLKTELGKGNGNGNGNGNGGSGGAGGGGNAAGEAGAGAVCVDHEQGSSTSCKDAATWKLYASQDCESESLLLDAYTPREACGDQLYRYVDYTCCPVAPPPPSDCAPQEQGGETSCKDVGTWKLYASQACEGEGLMLGDYAPREVCGDELYRYVDYTCCPLPPTEPPLPPGCIRQEQGSDNSCKTNWNELAAQTCESSGMLLADYVTREECGPNSYRYVDYVCCPGEPPPPPTDCIESAQGGVGSCKDVPTWKLYASQDCLAGGRALFNYETQDECGENLYSYVKYTCCPN